MIIYIIGGFSLIIKMDPCDIIPPELIYDILLKLSYNDIMSYIQSSIKIMRICDTVFWMNKLDYDFESCGRDILIPSLYVKKYHEIGSGKNTYRRWIHLNDIRNMLLSPGGEENLDKIEKIYLSISGNDIILFQIDRGDYGTHGAVFNKIYELSLETGNVIVLEKLLELHPNLLFE